ncbi:molybdate ABC transporter permease subunit [Fuchsiella alkaliacetigena]|uniref:molybdate ABC transporter permease subunit n=1 Tax=Fuchsiella alkaliacetigena TaxID=957042 RepID=UPI00200A2A10|nr:molybdate ABC transporter permease subunit [Fuchsiella alkaliacetigena]MCK8824793.1 molybdate ABC transporter permease subunit [Fuchsiella alkaliacetigena]
MYWSPIYLSVKIAFFSTVITTIVGTLLAWLLARGDFWGKDILSSITVLPMILPPTVLGYYLLTFMGKNSFIGRFLEETFNISLVFTWQGAVLAAVIVSLPLMIRSVQSSIESVDQNLENAARTLGKSELSIFLKITLPLSWKGIVVGIVLSFARALGEFGATLMIAGNIPGKTQTLSIAIYDAVQGGNYQLANFLVILISTLSILSLLLLNKFLDIEKW